MHDAWKSLTAQQRGNLDHIQEIDEVKDTASNAPLSPTIFTSSQPPSKHQTQHQNPLTQQSTTLHSHTNRPPTRHQHRIHRVPRTTPTTQSKHIVIRSGTERRPAVFIPAWKLEAKLLRDERRRGGLTARRRRRSGNRSRYRG